MTEKEEKLKTFSQNSEERQIKKNGDEIEEERSRGNLRRMEGKDRGEIKIKEEKKELFKSEKMALLIGSTHCAIIKKQSNTAMLDTIQ